jgi:hypothetical protein
MKYPTAPPIHQPFWILKANLILFITGSLPEGVTGGLFVSIICIITWMVQLKKW